MADFIPISNRPRTVVRASTGVPEFHHTFANKSDGLLPYGFTSDSGQPVHTAVIAPDPNDPLVKPYVQNGQLVMRTAAFPAASYLQPTLQSTARYIGMRFSVNASPAHTTDSGVMAIGAFDYKIYNASVRASAHMGFNNYAYNIQVLTAGAVFVTLETGYFRQPLVADGVTQYSVEIYINPEQGTMIVFMPDGQIKKFSHPIIKETTFIYPFWEPYRLVAADQYCNLRYMAADSQDEGLYAKAEAAYFAQSQQNSSSKYEGAGGQEYFVAPVNTPTTLTSAITCYTVAGPTGKIVAEFEGWLIAQQQTNATDPVFLVDLQATAVSGVSQNVQGLLLYIQKYTGLVSKRYIFQGLTPGVMYTITAKHWQYSAAQVAGGNNFFQVWSALGQSLQLTARPSV